MRDREALGCGSSLRMGLRKINSCYHSFTLGTGLTLVCQGPPATSSTPNRGGRSSQTTYTISVADGQDCHHLPSTPTILAELEANKDNLRLRHHAYAFDYYSRVAQGYPIFIRGPLLEYPLREWTMNPRTNENNRITLLELTE